MLRLGEFQHLMIIKKDSPFVLLSEGRDTRETVRLPIKECPKDLKEKDYVKVFLYRDGNEEITATMRRPKITMGTIALLEARETTAIGAFLDWGLEKDLFLPFKEQTRPVEKGKIYPVFLYVDKSRRLAASMKLKDFLRTDHRYRANDRVKGVVYSIHPNIGAFVAVDGKYDALIDRKDIFGVLELGEEVEARVVFVRRDGKMKLVLREKAYRTMDHDSQVILGKLREMNGEMPYHDKSDPDVIRSVFAMSKSSFKRALGRLYKQRTIDITRRGVKLKKR